MGGVRETPFAGGATACDGGSGCRLLLVLNAAAPPVTLASRGAATSCRSAQKTPCFSASFPCLTLFVPSLP
jgi:hypothetical protein